MAQKPREFPLDGERRCVGTSDCWSELIASGSQLHGPINFVGSAASAACLNHGFVNPLRFGLPESSRWVWVHMRFALLSPVICNMQETGPRLCTAQLPAYSTIQYKRWLTIFLSWIIKSVGRITESTNSQGRIFSVDSQRPSQFDLFCVRVMSADCLDPAGWKMRSARSAFRDMIPVSNVSKIVTRYRLHA